MSTMNKEIKNYQFKAETYVDVLNFVKDTKGLVKVLNIHVTNPTLTTCVVEISSSGDVATLKHIARLGRVATISNSLKESTVG